MIILQLTEAKRNEEIQQLFHTREMTDRYEQVFLNIKHWKTEIQHYRNLLSFGKIEACGQLPWLTSLGAHSAVQFCSEAISIYFVAQCSRLSAANILEIFSNIEIAQGCDRCERAHNFLVICINCLERGMLVNFSVSCLANVISFRCSKIYSI